MLKKRFYQLTAAALCLSLIWTSADTAQVIGYAKDSYNGALRMPHIVQPNSDPSYFTQEAIVQRLIFPHFARPSLGILYKRLLQPATVGEFLVENKEWVNVATPVAFFAATV